MGDSGTGMEHIPSQSCDLGHVIRLSPSTTGRSVVHHRRHPLEDGSAEEEEEEAMMNSLGFVPFCGHTFFFLTVDKKDTRKRNEIICFHLLSKQETRNKNKTTKTINYYYCLLFYTRLHHPHPHPHSHSLIIPSSFPHSFPHHSLLSVLFCPLLYSTISW